MAVKLLVEIVPKDTHNKNQFSHASGRRLTLQGKIGKLVLAVSNVAPRMLLLNL